MRRGRRIPDVVQTGVDAQKKQLLRRKCSLRAPKTQQEGTDYRASRRLLRMSYG